MYLITYVLTYVFISWPTVLLGKLTGFQPAKKCTALYGTLKFITAFTNVCHLSVSWASPIQPTHPHPETHLNIIFPSTPGSPQFSLSLRFTHQNPTHASHLHIRATCPSISFFSILSPAQFWVNNTRHEAPHYDVFYTPLLSPSPLTPNTPHNPHSQTPSPYVPPQYKC
jgi:hypothetical protein